MAGLPGYAQVLSVLLLSARSRYRFLEQEPNFRPMLDEACYSGYLGNSWGKGKGKVSSFSTKLEIL
jgi:hypothetical protein